MIEQLREAVQWIRTLKEIAHWNAQLRNINSDHRSLMQKPAHFARHEQEAEWKNRGNGEIQNVGEINYDEDIRKEIRVAFQLDR